MNKLKFNDIFQIKNKYNYTIVYLDCTVLYNLRNRPTFHAEERLVNLARGRECFVDLSIYIRYIVLYIVPLPGDGGPADLGRGDEVHAVPDQAARDTEDHAGALQVGVFEQHFFV